MIRLYTTSLQSSIVYVASGTYKHLESGLPIRTDVRGFYFEGNWSMMDGVLLVLREDIPNIHLVSYQETMNHPAVLAIGSGNFICPTGKVKISERLANKAHLKVNILVSTNDECDTTKLVSQFNKTVQALLDGQLIPIGSNQSVVEKMQKEINILNVEQEFLRSRVSILSVEALLARKFIEELGLYLQDKFTFPSLAHGAFGSDLLAQVTRLKAIEQSFWYKLIYEIIPHPIKYLRSQNLPQ